MTKRKENCGPHEITEDVVKAETEPTENKQGSAGLKLTYFVAMVVVSAVASLSSVIVYDRYYAQKIVSMDLKGYMDDQRSQYAAKKLGDEQLDKNIARIKEIVEKVPKNKVILMGDVVIKNAEVIKLEPNK